MMGYHIQPPRSLGAPAASWGWDPKFFSMRVDGGELRYYYDVKWVRRGIDRIFVTIPPGEYSGDEIREGWFQDMIDKGHINNWGSCLNRWHRMKWLKFTGRWTTSKVKATRNAKRKVWEVVDGISLDY